MPRIVMRASEAQKQRTKVEEGLRLDTYLDTKGIPTVGWGHAATNPRPVRGTHVVDGQRVYYTGKPIMGVSITLAEAERLFAEDFAESEAAVSDAIAPNIELTQNQFDAVLDFHHQYGSGFFLGSTLLRMINLNPNNTAILDEFARWNIAGGVRDEALYRRSCRRACVYAGVPIPHKLWDSKNFPWAEKNGLVDYTIVPTVHELVALGKKHGSKPVFDPAWPSRPAPDPQPVLPPKQDAAAPSSTVETPAVDLSPPANVEAAPVPSPLSPPERPTISDDTGTTLREDSGAGAAGNPPSIETSAAPTLELDTVVVLGTPAPVAPLPKFEAAPEKLPPVVAPPKPPPVILPRSVNLDAVPYGEITTANGAKLMSDARRVIGIVIVGIGSVIQILAAREIVSSTIGAIFYDMSRDTTLVALAGGAGAWVISKMTNHHGTQVIAKGMVEAKQVLV
jgi:lysozyme